MPYDQVGTLSSQNWHGARWLIRQVHLYLSLSLGIVLIAIALSGAALVWREQIDRWLMPELYAVSGSEIKLPPSAYISNALAAAGAHQRIVEVRYPDAASLPIRVMTRSAPSPGKPASTLMVFLDPPDGAVLGVVGISTTLTGILHNFHHMLSLPQFGGRQIVGWFGVGMLLISLSGIYLWWPRSNNLKRALRWARSSTTASNLHHLFGIWISLPLIVVLLSGIYISFPVTANRLTSSLVPTGAFRGHGYGAQPLPQTVMTIDQALEAAHAISPAVEPKMITVPISNSSQNAGHNYAAHSPQWRLTFRDNATNRDVKVLVRDHDGSASIVPEPLTGDRAAAFIKSVHEGRVGGTLWAVFVFLTGALPVLFAYTGLLIWLRRRAKRKALASRP